jgi:hypothetical protein
MAGRDVWKVLPFISAEWLDKAKSFKLFLRGAWIYRCLTLAKMACRQTGGEKAEDACLALGLERKAQQGVAQSTRIRQGGGEDEGE